MTHSPWQFKCTGWPWWIVLPMAILGVWSLIRLHRRELSSVPDSVRLRLLLLRGCALGLILLFFLEPNFSRSANERVLPAVAVIVDQSGSMAVKDEMMPENARLNEAIGLGLVPVSVRSGTSNAAAATVALDRGILTNALASLQGLSRHQIAIRLALEKIQPALQDRARVSFYGLDDHLLPLDRLDPSRLLPNRNTDFEAALGELARDTSQDYVGGVILLTDGRQTSGLDPVPIVRALHARGAAVSALLVGDPNEPPDAVVADVSGPAEVFLGENTPMNARYRITGARDMEWDLVLTENGRELARRPVRETHGWEYENFVFPATNLGVNVYRARVEPARDPAANRVMELTGGATVETWKKVQGSRVAEFFGTPAADKAPTTTTTITKLEYGRRGEQYAARVRGFLIPPQSGDYIFWISSDDGSELWVSPTADPAKKSRVAYVTDFVAEGRWDIYPTQRSQPVTLRAAQPCYFEILHKQGGGEDHLTVGWTLPDGVLERPIRANRLTSYDEPSIRRLREREQSLARSNTNGWKEASLANNSAETTVTVNQDSMKVLLVDSTPRWESRYLAAMFERDRRVSLTRRYHSIIMEDPRLALLPKTQAEWDAFDMVCLGDLDAHELPPAQQQFLLNFVARRGGFLACLAGPRGMPQSFGLGQLGDVLPVRIGAPANRDQEPVRVVLTRQGADHPITQVLDDPLNNEKAWPLLPPLQWIADGVVAKPAATVLLAAKTPAKTPIVAFQRYGAGRVFWIGTEETWRWRDRLGDRVHQTFWLQAMRWGLAGRLRGQDARLQAGLDHSLVGPGETAEFKVRVAPGSAANPSLPPVLVLEQLDSQGKVIGNLSDRFVWVPAPELPGLWRLNLENLPEGRWRVSAQHPDSSLKQLVETRELLVRGQNSTEGLDLGGDLPALKRIATAGGGLSGTMDQTGAVLEDLAGRLKPRWIEHRQTIRLWNSFPAMIIVMALLCLEWLLRKRQGLP